MAKADNYKAGGDFKRWTSTGRIGHTLALDEVGSTAYESRTHTLGFAVRGGNHLVKAGKARYIGASSMYAYQFCKALYLADLHGWTRFVSMQNHYNLLYREEEREMLRLCREEGVGVIPWSPLARGRLTRDFDEKTFRTETDQYGKHLHKSLGDADRAVIDAVAQVAQARGVPRAQVALAWVASRPGVTAPIIGASKPAHLSDAVAGLALQLTPEEVQALEKPYIPHAVAGFS